MTHLSKRGVPTWQEQLAASRQKKHELAARALKKEKYTLVEGQEPRPYIQYYGDSISLYMPLVRTETKWLSEEEATLRRLKGLQGHPIQKAQASANHQFC